MSRHRDGSDMSAGLERQRLAFLHQARKVRDLGDDQVERIASRLQRATARPRRVLLWPALATVALLMVAGTALAVARGGLRALPIVGPLLSPTPAPVPKTIEFRRRRGLPTTGGQQKGEGPGAAVPAPPPITQPGEMPAHATFGQPLTIAQQDPLSSPGRERAHVTARAAKTPARDEATDDSIVPESQSFATVIESWHRQHDAGNALVLLDAHEQRYPAGHIRLETRVLRAEIYLAQGRKALALSVLDGMSLSGIPRARELQTLRGELRAQAGRCQEARSDLSGVLETSVADDLAKRATQTLAHCP